MKINFFLKYYNMYCYCSDLLIFNAIWHFMYPYFHKDGKCDRINTRILNNYGIILKWRASVLKWKKKQNYFLIFYTFVNLEISSDYYDKVLHFLSMIWNQKEVVFKYSMSSLKKYIFPHIHNFKNFFYTASLLITPTQNLPSRRIHTNNI